MRIRLEQLANGWIVDASAENGFGAHYFTTDPARAVMDVIEAEGERVKAERPQMEPLRVRIPEYRDAGH